MTTKPALEAAPETATNSAAAEPRTVNPKLLRRPRTGLPGQRRLTRRSSMPLFASGATEEFRTRWLAIQANFVDEPEASVERADALVAEVMREIDKTFAEKRARLDPQKTQGEFSTEDLRLALRAYRSFFDRLLSI
jgi:hypothetical protein